MLNSIPCACCTSEARKSLSGEDGNIGNICGASPGGTDGVEKNQTQIEEIEENTHECLDKVMTNNSVDSDMDSYTDSKMDSHADTLSHVDSDMDSCADSHMDSCKAAKCPLHQNCHLGAVSNHSCHCHCKSTPVKCRNILEFLEKGKSEDFFKEFLLPQKVLSKFVLLLGECYSVGLRCLKKVRQ